MDPVVLAVTYKVPVVVEEENTMLTWTVDTLSEVSTHLKYIHNTYNNNNIIIIFKHFDLGRMCAGTTSAS